MPARLQQMLMTIVASFIFWFGVAMVDVVAQNADIRDAAAIIAFLATLALWIVLVLTPPSTAIDAEQSIKAKREDVASTRDDRLALLMSLMTDDERHTLQARLADEIVGDGEIPLADLLAAQDNEATSQNHTS